MAPGELELMICHAELVVKQHVDKEHKLEQQKILEQEALKGKRHIVGGKIQDFTSSSSSDYDYNNFEIDGSHLAQDPSKNKDKIGLHGAKQRKSVLTMSK